MIIPVAGEPSGINRLCALLIGVIAIIWLGAGIAGYIISILCWKYTGTKKQKIIGIVIALLTGPIYWLYFFLSKNYCKNIEKII